MNRRKWSIGVQVGLVVALVVAVVLTVFTRGHVVPDRVYRAVLQAKGLTLACEAYHENPSSGNKYPAKLADLHSPPFGGSSFLRNGEEDLLDPWGNPFKYAVVPDAKGEPELYVWSEQTVDGKLQFIGAKRTAGGSTVLFGIE
jgi:hypothetical protein